MAHVVETSALLDPVAAEKERVAESLDKAEHNLEKMSRPSSRTRRESVVQVALGELEKAAHGARALVGLHDDLDERRALLRVALILTLFFVAYSIFFGMYEMGYGITSSVYLMAQTVTTVGYGDLVPQNDEQRAILTLYMWVAAAIAGIALSIIASSVFAYQDHQVDRWSSVNEATYVTTDENNSLLGGRAISRLDRCVGLAQRRFAVVSAQIVGLLLFGAVIMWMLEGWTFAKGIYWGTTTATTIGYGDVVPTSIAAKWVATPYMVVATLAFTHWASNLIRLLSMVQDRAAARYVIRQFGDGLTLEKFEGLFTGHDELQKNMLRVQNAATGKVQGNLAAALFSGGSAPTNTPLGRHAFVLQMLILLGKVETDDILDCNDMFDKLDSNNDSQLNQDDIEIYVRHKQMQKMHPGTVEQSESA